MKSRTNPDHKLEVTYDPAADLCWIEKPIGPYRVKKNGQAIWAVTNNSGKDVTLCFTDWQENSTGTPTPATPFTQPPPYTLYVPDKKTEKLSLDLSVNALITRYKYVVEVNYLNGGHTRTWRSADPDLIVEGSATMPHGKPSKPAEKPAKPGKPPAKGKKATRKR